MTAKEEEHFFAKMGNGDKALKLTEDTSASVKRTGFIKVLLDNIKLVAILIGVILGVSFGLGLRPYHLSSDTLIVISYPGEIFMRLLKLMILPLIIASLIAGSASLNAKMSGKIAVRTLTYFVLTSMFNALLGILLALWIHPGQPELKEGYTSTVENRKDHNILDSILDIGRNIFTDNIVQATFQQSHTVYVEAANTFATSGSVNDTVSTLERVVGYRSGTNTLGLVFFCLLFGSFLGTIGPKGQVLTDFFQAIFEVIMKMVTGVIWFTPIGVTSVIAGKILAVNDVAQVMSQLAWFIATVTIGIVFYQLIVMQLIYFMFLKRNPFKFYWGLMHAMLTACATGSTAATLPVTFKAMEGPLQIDSRITRFVLPIGCNINTDGIALFLPVSTMFICQINNIPLGFAKLVTIFLTSIAASLSAASVPSAAMVLLLIVLSSIDAPTHDVSLLFAVDWLVDRIRTTNNMLGDCYASAVVEHLSRDELKVCDTHTMEPLIGLNIDTEDNIDIMTLNKTSKETNEVVIDMNLQNNHIDTSRTDTDKNM